MRWSLTTLLGAAMLARAAMGELTFTVTGTRKGVPIPKNEIKLTPFEPGRSGIGHPRQGPRDNSKRRRANPTYASSNWCGSVQTTASTNQITFINGAYQHPGCSIRSGVTQFPQAVAPWIGIDGDSYSSALLQSGTACKIDNSTGIVRHEAWWQWYPGAAWNFNSFAVNAGDWINVSINVTSATEASLTISNYNTQVAYTLGLHNGPSLGRVNADWVVERPIYGSGLAPMADFDDVWYANAYATRQTGTNLGILGAKQYQITSLCASLEWDNQAQRSWAL